MRLCFQAAVLALLLHSTVAAAGAAELDLRIVLDTSERMAQQDTLGLRAYAADLLVRGLPDEARAGIWSYDRHTRQVAPYEQANGLWKQVASIHSNALPSGSPLSDLPHALRAATWDLQEIGRGQVHVVVFSTGVIDTVADEASDVGARIELLNEWATALRPGRTVVHTLAVQLPASDGARVQHQQDLELLKQISHLSGGLHATVADKEQLREAVLRIQDLSTAASQLQIDGDGRFQIAPGTERFTILWFADDTEAAPVSLRTPGGRRLGRLVSLSRGRWLLTDEFEIVTLEAPEPGWWQVEGPKPARLAVYGDLDVRVIGLDNPVVPTDQTSARIELFSQGRRVDNADFLNLLEIKAWVEDERGRELVPVEHNGSGFDVRFVRLRDGLQELDLRIIAPTFARRVRVPFVVSNPLRVEVGNNASGQPVAWVHFTHAEVNYGALRVAARVRKPPGIASLVPGQAMPAGMWQIPLLSATPGLAESYDGIIEAAFSIAGNYLDGKGFFLKTSPQAIALPLQEGERITLRFNADGKLLEDPDPLPTGGDWEPFEDPDMAAGDQAAAASAQLSDMSAPHPQPRPRLLQLPLWLVGVLSLLSLCIGGVTWWLYRPRPVLFESAGSAAGAS